MRRTIAAMTSALLCGVTAGAESRPLAQPVELRSGVLADLVFNARDARYLLAFQPPSRGSFRSVAVSDIAASGPLAARDIDSAGTTANLPGIAYDSQRNRYLLTYVELAQSSDAPATGVWGKISSGDGRAVFGPSHLADATGPPRAAFGAARGEYLVVFADTSSQGRRILGQRVSADGALIGGPISISDRAELVHNDSPDVAYRPVTSDFIVVWRGTRADSSHAVFAQRVRDDGTEAGSEDLQLSRPMPTSAAPALASQTTGTDTVVAWSDGTAVQAAKLHGRRPLARPARSISSPRNQPGAVSVAFQPTAREFVIVWAGVGPESPTDPRLPSPASTIFGQHLTPNLREIGPDDFAISETVSPPPASVPLGQSRPAVAADPASTGYVAAWTTDTTTINGTFSMVARRLTSEPPVR